MNSIVHSNSSTSAVLHQEWYSFDAANNLQTKIVNSALTSYTYDGIDQLLTENGGDVANTYAYDANGNRTSKNAELYTYDDGDKLLTRGSTSYSYDECGRTKTIVGPSGTRTFTWDYEDRLTNLSGGGVSSTNYGYNGLGTRTSKSNSSGSRTYKRNGVGVTAPVLSDGVASMVPGISEKSGGVTSFTHTDRLGSMKSLSASGAVTDTANYDAFGMVVSRTGTTNTQKGFASGFGYQEDGESGYKLLGHRYYDSETGRFLSRDRGFDGNNWYSYCGNNPSKFIDAEGLKKKLYIIVGNLAGEHDIRNLFKLVMYLIEKYSEEYDIEIKDARTPTQFDELMTECDAAVCIGHGGPFSTKRGTVQPGDLLEIARRRRRRNRAPLDFVILFSCNCFTSGEADAADWWHITNRVAGYRGFCYPTGDPDDAFNGLEWFQKPGTSETDLPKWVEFLPKPRPTKAPRGVRRPNNVPKTSQI